MKDPLLKNLNDDGEDAIGEKSVNCCGRRISEKNCRIVTGIIVITSILVFFLVPPLIIEMVMKDVIESDSTTVDVIEMEMFAIRDGGLLDVRMKARMNADVWIPFPFEGESKVGVMQMYIPDSSTDYSTLGLMGSVDFPKLEFDSLDIDIDIVTTMYITSDKFFHVLVGDVLINETVTACMEGDMGIKATVLWWWKVDTTVRLSKCPKIKALNGLTFDVIKMYERGSTIDTVTIEVEMLIYNTAAVYSSVVFEIYNCLIPTYYKGVYLGDMILTSMNLGKEPSINSGEITIIQTEENYSYISEFMVEYMLGGAVSIFCNGTLKAYIGLPRTPDDPAPFVDVLTIPPLEGEFVKSIHAPLRQGPGGPIVQIPLLAFALFENPLFDVSIVAAEMEAYGSHPCNRTVGFLDEDYSDDPLFLPGYSQTCLGLEMDIAREDFACVADGIINNPDGFYMTLINSNLTMLIGEFRQVMTLTYGPIRTYLGPCPLNDTSTLSF